MSDTKFGGKILWIKCSENSKTIHGKSMETEEFFLETPQEYRRWNLWNFAIFEHLRKSMTFHHIIRWFDC